MAQHRLASLPLRSVCDSALLPPPLRVSVECLSCLPSTSIDISALDSRTGTCPRFLFFSPRSCRELYSVARKRAPFVVPFSRSFFPFPARDSCIPLASRSLPRIPYTPSTPRPMGCSCGGQLERTCIQRTQSTLSVRAHRRCERNPKHLLQFG